MNHKTSTQATHSASNHLVKQEDPQSPSLVGCLDLSGQVNHVLGPPRRSTWFGINGRPIGLQTKSNSARLYDIATGDPVGALVSTPDPIRSSLISPDTHYLLTFHGHDNLHEIRLWEISTGRLILSHSDSGIASDLTFSEDGTRLAMIPSQGTGRLWETSTGRLVASPENRLTGDAKRLRISHDNQRLIWTTHAEPPSVCLWTADIGSRAAVLKQHNRHLKDIEFSHDGTMFVTSSFDTTARVWDWETLRPLTTALEHDDGLVESHFSPDDQSILTISEDRTARLWNVRTGVSITSPLIHDGPVLEGQFSRDGRYVVTASKDMMVRIWDSRTGSLAYPMLPHHAPVVRATFDATCRYILTKTEDQVAHVWDLAAAHAPCVLIDNRGQGSIKSVFTSDGRLLTAGAVARILDPATGRPLSPALAHEDGPVGDARSEERGIVSSRTVRSEVSGFGMPAHSSPLRRC